MIELLQGGKQQGWKNLDKAIEEALECVLSS